MTLKNAKQVGSDAMTGTFVRALAATVLSGALTAIAYTAAAQNVLPRPEPQFQGTVGRTTAESSAPQWPKPV